MHPMDSRTEPTEGLNVRRRFLFIATGVALIAASARGKFQPGDLLVSVRRK